MDDIKEPFGGTIGMVKGYITPAELLNKTYEMSVQEWDATDRVMLNLIVHQTAARYEAHQHPSGYLVVTFYGNTPHPIATYGNVSYVKEA